MTFHIAPRNLGLQGCKTHLKTENPNKISNKKNLKKKERNGKPRSQNPIFEQKKTPDVRSEELTKTCYPLWVKFFFESNRKRLLVGWFFSKTEKVKERKSLKPRKSATLSAKESMVITGNRGLEERTAKTKRAKAEIKKSNEGTKP